MLLRRHQERKRKDLLPFCDFFSSPAFKTSVAFFPLEGRGGKKENGKGKEHDSTGKARKGFVRYMQSMNGWKWRGPETQCPTRVFTSRDENPGV